MDHLVGKCPFGGVFRSSFCRRAAVKKHKNYRILLGNSGHSWETLGNHEIGPKSTQNSLFRCFRRFCVLCKGKSTCGAIFGKNSLFRGFQLEFRVCRGLYPASYRPLWTDSGRDLDEIWTRSGRDLDEIWEILRAPGADPEALAQIPELWLRSLSSGSDHWLCWPHTYLVSAG